MRASSLSNAKVIALLNSYFVPVYVSNEDYRDKGPASAEEKKEYRRIYLEALKQKLSAGTVHAYVTAPDGHTIDSQHVATAYKPEKLTEMLERTITRLKTKAGKPLVTPAPQSRTPKAEANSLVLHLVSRHLKQQGNDWVPTQARLGESGSANWGSYPQENWIVLTKEDLAKCLPAGKLAKGQTWSIEKDVAGKILTYFYPSTENNDVSKNRIDHLTLKATVVSLDDGVIRARLEGSLKMKHPFYHKDDGNFVEASIAGYLDVNAQGTKVLKFRLATDKATYGRLTFGVAVRSMP